MIDDNAALADFIFYTLFAPACGVMSNRVMYVPESVLQADEAIFRRDKILNAKPLKEQETKPAGEKRNRGSWGKVT